MKILQINSNVGVGSTGRIAEGIGKKVLGQNSWQSYIAYGRDETRSASKVIKIGSSVDVYLHAIATRITDRNGLFSTRSTNRFLKLVLSLSPDIIHIHNLHAYYINYKILFEFIRSHNIPVIWTFHDCWPITGHCVYFDSVNCNKWEVECQICPQLSTYPTSYLDNSKANFNLKKELYGNLEKFHVVTVSNWLSNIVRRSFLSSVPVSTIYNGIDLEVFKPIEPKKNWFLKNDKFIVLGVASPWTKRKGLDDFFVLRNLLPITEYLIILVGLNKTQIRSLPSGIIGIEKTNSVSELVEFYSTADAYVNLTHEDNFPTTNIEALACGVPVITYRAGGSAEAICAETGFSTKVGDILGVVDKLEIIKKKGKKYFTNSCRNRALNFFNSENNYDKYIDIYKRLI